MNINPDETTSATANDAWHF